MQRLSGLEVAIELETGQRMIVVAGPTPPGPRIVGDPVTLPSAPEQRSKEVTGGRTAARRALSVLGVQTAGIPRDADGVPVWPPGTLGSIAHDRDLVAVVVAAAAPGVRGVGIDLERVGAIEPELHPHVLTAAERTMLEAGVPDADLMATVIFCAKEAAFKAQFPQTGRWLEFDEVEVEVHPASPPGVESGVLSVRVAGLARPLMACWCRLGDSVVVTAIDR